MDGFLKSFVKALDKKDLSEANTQLGELFELIKSSVRKELQI